MRGTECAGGLRRPATVACPVQQARSGGLPFVAVVQTADFGSHHDAAGRLDGAFHRRILAECEVRARPLVVRDVGPKDPTKMPLIEDDDVVLTLAADRADHAFDVGILPGRARCRADGRETEGLDRPTERRVEGRVAVVEEEPRVRVVGKGLAKLLSGSRGRWVIRHLDMQDTSPSARVACADAASAGRSSVQGGVWRCEVLANHTARSSAIRERRATCRRRCRWSPATPHGRTRREQRLALFFICRRSAEPRRSQCVAGRRPA